MNKIVKVQISVLIGILGFFLGGILNLNKEIIDIILYASIGWCITFFSTFFLLSFLNKEKEVNIARSNVKYEKKDKNKGKKIDIIISDDLNEIYNLKR
jgi:hypothetical protein